MTACLVATCATLAAAGAPMCAAHWACIAPPLQRAVLAKYRGEAPDNQLADIAAACGGEIVAVRPLRTDFSSGESE